MFSMLFYPVRKSLPEEAAQVKRCPIEGPRRRRLCLRRWIAWVSVTSVDSDAGGTRHARALCLAYKCTSPAFCPAKPRPYWPGGWARRDGPSDAGARRDEEANKRGENHLRCEENTANNAYSTVCSDNNATTPTPMQHLSFFVSRVAQNEAYLFLMPLGQQPSGAALGAFMWHRTCFAAAFRCPDDTKLQAQAEKLRTQSTYLRSNAMKFHYTDIPGRPDAQKENKLQEKQIPAKFFL